jgi:hypothetical protein
MSLLTVAEVRAAITTSLSDDALQSVIDQQEAWLARRIGPLDGERTQHFLNLRPTQIIHLQRPTSAITVEEDAVAVADVELRRNSWRVARTSGSWAAEADITYEPNDLLEVQRALLEGLIPLALTATGMPSAGYQSETMGTYSYTLGTGSASPKAIRSAVVQSLKEPAEPSTNRVRPSLLPEPIGVTIP